MYIKIVLNTCVATRNAPQTIYFVKLFLHHLQPLLQYHPVYCHHITQTINTDLQYT